MTVVTNPGLVVKAIAQAPEKDNHQNWSYWVDAGLGKNVLVVHKGEKPVMQPGDTFQQHGFAGYEEKLSSGGNEYFKAVRPQAQNNGYGGGGQSGGGGGGGSYSPEVQARIDAVGRAKSRCHAQEMSVRALAASGAFQTVDLGNREQAGAFLNGVLRPLADWFMADSERAKESA